MIYVGIDVAKDKHNCFITNSDGEVLYKPLNAFGSQAKPGTMYVEFDVDSSRIYQAGNEGWGQIPGPGSLYDRLNIKKGLPPISDMPNAYNISIGERNDKK
nr:hypothetical protein [Pseudobutyrivibrio ruminis]